MSTLVDSPAAHPAPLAARNSKVAPPPKVAVLTGGGDKPYAWGLAAALAERSIEFDFIGSDDLESEELLGNRHIRFLNLRGSQDPAASPIRKLTRLSLYYLRLLRYAIVSHAPVFHILWNSKIELLDRTLLTLFYRWCGRRVVMTVHNVNAARRDGTDSPFNRATLGFQYRRMDHLFVHTAAMKRELREEFRVREERISVIPFGLNTTVRDSGMSPADARRRLSLPGDAKTVLFFGLIAPYKGLEYMIAALGGLAARDPGLRALVVGRPKDCPEYWARITDQIAENRLEKNVLARIEFVPDDETEVYFKAADALVLPYTHIFQSGVMILGYNFGLPVLASDVGSFRDDIVEGKTGYIFPPRDSLALERTIERYFDSDLYRDLPQRRGEIRAFARERFSWDRAAAIMHDVYSSPGCLPPSAPSAACPQP